MLVEEVSMMQAWLKENGFLWTMAHCKSTVRSTTPHRVNIKSSVLPSQTWSVSEDNGGTFTGRPDTERTAVWPDSYQNNCVGPAVSMHVCAGDRAGKKDQQERRQWCWQSNTKAFFSPKSKAKKDKNGSDNRDLLITAWGCGESDRGAGMDAAGGLPCCRPKSLPNTMCLCQPTTNSRKKKKKKSHHQIVDSQLPWPKNNNTPPTLNHSKTHMHNTLPRPLPSIWPEHHGHHRWQEGRTLWWIWPRSDPSW